MPSHTTPLMRRRIDGQEHEQSPIARGRGDAIGIPSIPVEWQHLWFSVVQKSWTSLALVPSHPRHSALDAALQLVNAAHVYGDAPLRLVDATAVVPTDVRDVIAQIEAETRAGTRHILAVDSPLRSPQAIALSRAVGAALLVVPLGAAGVRDTRRTVDSIGRSYFIGAISVRSR